jgi:predicted nucleotidyltransferase
LEQQENKNMDREQVIATLRGHESVLRAAGVIRLSVFGSTARGDNRPDSDIDLLAVFDDSRRISLLDVAGIERQISQMLGHSVELVEGPRRSPRRRIARMASEGRDTAAEEVAMTFQALGKSEEGAALPPARPAPV